VRYSRLLVVATFGFLGCAPETSHLAPRKPPSLVSGARCDAKSEARPLVVEQDGAWFRLLQASGANTPPAGCSALTQIELVVLAEGKPCPPHTAWNGSTCASALKCPRGAVPMYGSCAETGIHYDDLSNACLQPDIAACEAECERGNPASCSEVGRRYAGGEGVKEDFAAAARFAKKSCDGGNPRGCTTLSGFYSSGRGGLPLDKRKAFELSSSSCENGIALACVVAGEALDRGDVVARDANRALALFERSCTGGDALGCRVR
jgi:hypothetical protein